MIKKQVMIINKLGLHARASSKLVQLAETFESQINITKGNRTANGKSIMSVMMLSAAYGSIIEIEAAGSDEEEAVKALNHLIKSKFGEFD